MASALKVARDIGSTFILVVPESLLTAAGPAVCKEFGRTRDRDNQFVDEITPQSRSDGESVQR